MISQVLTLFITPVLFIYMDRLSEGVGRLFSRSRDEGKPLPAPAE